MSDARPDQRSEPETVELAAELDEAIDRGDPEEIEQLGQELYDAGDGSAGPSSSD